jgi:metal-responsive CopG/Arc/MetJ family transcriptional regulator
MVRISVPLPEDLWRRLRDLAESQRAGGRTSVSRVIREMVEKSLQPSAAAAQ